MLRREGIAREPIDSERVLSDLAERVTARLGGRGADLLINDCCFQELQRMRRARRKHEDPEGYPELLEDARSRLAHADPDALREILHGLARHYAEEVHGHFDPRIYERATRVLPTGLGVLLKGQQPARAFEDLFRGGLRQGIRAGLERVTQGGTDLSDRISITGALPTFDRLVERGTCVLVPTHLSNLDSPVVGWALHAAGLPPMIYGAGINLFTNWVMSYFMDHLGAYKVDRVKNARLYKEVLKEYSTYALEQRWHSLFFPGGTRSRSGRVEGKLKKGLMGTALAAYQANLRAGRDKERLFFIPCTINYHLVLEAETLIEDSLQEEGKSRYIIADDEFSRPDRVAGYVRSMLALDDPIEVRFSRPLDPFGNPVDDEGDSIDPHGHRFDPRGYVMRDGEVVQDEQRDRVYTDRLADAIGRALSRDTVLFDTHVLAALMHRRLEARHPELDLYRRLLLPGDARTVPLREVDRELDHMLRSLRALAARGEVRLGELVAKGSAEAIRSAGLRHFAKYHTTRAVAAREDALVMEDPRLALYYANRLVHYPLPTPLPGELS